MRIDVNHIAETARAKGFDSVTLEKVLRLKEALQEFYRHPFLKDRLVLKGGTAINLFLAGLPRLSVDIDLNYVAQSDRELMLKERPDLEKAVRQMASGLRYRIQEGTNDHASLQLYLSYRNLMNRDDRMEVEVNFLMRVCVLPPTNRRAMQIAGEADCEFPVLKVEELMAGKLKAMIERAHPRDLYDLYRFLKSKTPHDSLLLKRITLLFASTLDRDLRDYKPGRYDAAFSEEAIRKLLYPMLSSEDRPTVVEMMSVVKPLLEETLNHKDAEPYLDAMARGEYRPELLFPDQPAISNRIANHPALIWKATNVTTYLTKRISEKGKKAEQD
jgi:hypothetical protein